MSVIWGEKGALSRVVDTRWYSWPTGLTNTQNGQGLDSYGGAFSYYDHLQNAAGSLNLHPDHLFATQPNVRKVTRFIAKKVAQVRIHGFERASNGDRARLTEGDLVDLLKKPSPTTTAFEAEYARVLDLCLWERATSTISSVAGGWRLDRIPPRNWAFNRDGLDQPTSIQVSDPVTQAESTMGLDRMLWYDGYPSSARSPMEALRTVLTEEHESGEYRKSLWRNGGRWPGWIESPADAPPMSEAAEANFRASVGGFASGGTSAGKVPIFQDGRKYHAVPSMTPENAQAVETRKLSLDEISSFFGVDATLVGSNSAANYSNVAAYWEILLDSLGDWFEQIQQGYNARLVPVVGRPGEYVEFNVAAKMRMSFTQQGELYSKAGGAPWMKISEIRERENLPYVEGTDRVIVPINVEVPASG